MKYAITFPNAGPLGDPKSAGMRACEEAGVTWWAEYAFGPPDEVRAHIRSGPLRI